VANITAQPAKQVDWKQVGLFLLLTFGITWGIDLVLYLTAGYGNNASALIMLQLQMLIPAASAIFLGLFIFKDSRIAWNSIHGNARRFLLFYLVFTLIYALIAMLSLMMPEQGAIFSAAGSSFGILSLLVLVALRGLGGKESFEKAGLTGGKPGKWLVYGMAFFLFYALFTGLNALFGLGQAVDVSEFLGALGGPEGSMSPGVFLLLAGIQTVLVGPFLGLMYGFGEEYGWRGFLQEQLIRLGKRRGILILGLIWSAWHYPVIWMGHNYPGYPVLGTLLMTFYTTALAFVLGYAMLKTGSIWLVAFLHALNNQTLAFFQGLVYTPSSPIFSFGAGIYGAALLWLVVLVLLRDPIWRDDQAEISRAEEIYPEP
jgi:membrane protease YdiL (CAAX protease family)